MIFLVNPDGLQVDQYKNRASIAGSDRKFCVPKASVDPIKRKFPHATGARLGYCPQDGAITI
jgi:hypothetical protein